MNVVQYHLNMLRNAVISSDVDINWRNLAMMDLDKLEALLTWTQIKEKSGTVPEENLSDYSEIIGNLMSPPKKQPIRLNSDEFFKIADHQFFNSIERDEKNQYTITIFQDERTTTYLGPDPETLTEPEKSVYLRMAQELLWEKGIPK